MALFGLDAVAGAPPEIRPSSSVLGHITAAAARLTGVAEGTLVSGDMHDVTVSAVGLGNLRPEVLSVTAGAFINKRC